MAGNTVIIGAGPAGVSVVETLRKYDKNTKIIVLSAEPFPPYSPPAMVDHFSHGSNAHLWRGENWPEMLGVEYMPGSVASSLDVDAQEITLKGGEKIYYDKLVLAMGSRLYAPLEGTELEGIYNFKSLSAANDLVNKIKKGEAQSAIIVGAGFIGVEIALLLRELGIKVTQIEMLDQVMPAMLDTDTALFAQNIMQQKGIDLKLNTKAEAFVGNGRAEGVKLDSGEILKADLFIAATGVQPNIGFIQNSSLKTNWGIRVDDHLRASSPNIYAAGDVVEVPDRLTGEVYVHANFPNATAQGHVVGLNLAGIDTTYEGAERMNSLKHLGLPILAVGLKAGDEVIELRQDGNRRALYVQNNRLVGYQLIGDISIAGALRTLMWRGEDIRPFKKYLIDPNFGQGTLAWKAIGI